jgi:hypothetical protein
MKQVECLLDRRAELFLAAEDDLVLLHNCVEKRGTLKADKFARGRARQTILRVSKHFRLKSHEQDMRPRGQPRGNTLFRDVPLLSS